MRTVVVTDPPRADVDDAETLGGYGVATVHEALGRVGYLGPEFRPGLAGGADRRHRGHGAVLARATT